MRSCQQWLITASRHDDDIEGNVQHHGEYRRYAAPNHVILAYIVEPVIGRLLRVDAEIMMLLMMII